MAGKQVRNNTSEPKEHGNGGKSTDKKDWRELVSVLRWDEAEGYPCRSWVLKHPRSINCNQHGLSCTYITLCYHCCGFFI